MPPPKTKKRKTYCHELIQTRKILYSCYSSWCIFPYHFSPYCWWKKSCTSWYGSVSHYLQGLYITGGAGFLPFFSPFSSNPFWRRPRLPEQVPVRALPHDNERSWKRVLVPVQPTKTNMEPENWWVFRCFSFSKVFFLGGFHVSFQGCRLISKKKSLPVHKDSHAEESNTQN